VIGSIYWFYQNFIFLTIKVLTSTRGTKNNPIFMGLFRGSPDGTSSGLLIGGNYSSFPKFLCDKSRTYYPPRLLFAAPAISAKLSEFGMDGGRRGFGFLKSAVSEAEWG
jgi:hypothetical protein